MEKVKEWVEKTKQALKEKEREQEIMEKFKQLFGFPPEQVRWNADRTLEAMTRIKELDEEYLILDRKVTEVTFTLLEEKEESYDLHWQFEQRKRPLYHEYRWSKRIGPYTVIIEILTKIY